MLLSITALDVFSWIFFFCLGVIVYAFYLHVRHKDDKEEKDEKWRKWWEETLP